jgi:hypothetical protein
MDDAKTSADLSNATAFFINSSEMHSGFDQGN